MGGFVGWIHQQRQGTVTGMPNRTQYLQHNPGSREPVLAMNTVPSRATLRII